MNNEHTAWAAHAASGAGAVSLVDLVLRVLLKKSEMAALVLGGSGLIIGICVRIALRNVFDGSPLVTLFPAILIAALVGGVRPALLIATCALLYAGYFLTPPFNGHELTASGAIGLLSGAMVAATQIALIELVRRAACLLRKEQDTTTTLLAERDLMFSELQHRVANNMQFIASLLSLQARRLPPGSPGRSALTDGADRLIQLSGVHRKLHDAQRAERGFEATVRDVLLDLLNATGCGGVRLTIEAAPIPLPVDNVATLILIVVEVATNAIKHVFSKSLGTTLKVCLARGQPGVAELSISDDGPGLPCDILANRGSQLGMTILQALASRLGGECHLQNRQGTVVTVVFPLVRMQAAGQPAEQIAIARFLSNRPV